MNSKGKMDLIQLLKWRQSIYFEEHGSVSLIKALNE